MKNLPIFLDLIKKLSRNATKTFQKSIFILKIPITATVQKLLKKGTSILRNNSKYLLAVLQHWLQ